jgi:TonB family protein
MSARTALILSLATLAAAAPAAAASSMSSLIRDYYPKESIARGEQGAVEFAVDLDEEARVDSCVVTRSSGYPRLDQATCDLMVLHAAFSPAVTEGGTRVATTRTGRINWRLPPEYSQNAARAPQPATFTKAQLEQGRLVCKRAGEVGSMIRTKAHCLTRLEWNEADAIAEEQVRKFINPVPSGN